MILRNPLQRIADEADMAGIKVRQTAEIVEDRAARRIGIERVDREIAPRRIFTPVVGERHIRAPPVGADIAAQRRHLDPGAAGDRGDRAVIDTGRDRLDPRRFEQGDHLLRRVRGRDVEIGHVDAEQRIAHRAADEPRLSRTQRGDQPVQPRPMPPGRIGQQQPVRRIPRFSRHARPHFRRRDKLTSIAAVAPQIRCSPHMIS